MYSTHTHTHTRSSPEFQHLLNSVMVCLGVEDTPGTTEDGAVPRDLRLRPEDLPPRGHQELLQGLRSQPNRHHPLCRHRPVCLRGE